MNYCTDTQTEATIGRASLRLCPVSLSIFESMTNFRSESEEGNTINRSKLPTKKLEGFCPSRLDGIYGFIFFNKNDVLHNPQVFLVHLMILP